MLSSKSIDILRKNDEKNIWNYVTALQQVQNALFLLEKDTIDPDALHDLSGRLLR